MRNSSPPASDVMPLNSADLDALHALIGDGGANSASFSNDPNPSESHTTAPSNTSTASATFASMEHDERPELAFEDPSPAQVREPEPEHVEPAPKSHAPRGDALGEALSMWRKNAESLADETAAMKRGLAEFDAFFGARMNEHERENEEWRRTVERLEANAKRMKDENARLRQRLDRAKRFNHEFEKFLDE